MAALSGDAFFLLVRDDFRRRALELILSSSAHLAQSFPCVIGAPHFSHGYVMRTPTWMNRPSRIMRLIMDSGAPVASMSSLTLIFG